MIKSEETTNPTSCLSKAQDDEPLFVLRAHDELAPLVVAYWAELATLSPHEPEKISEALRLASEMRQWKNTHG